MNKSSNATVTRILRGLAVAATGLALGAYAGTAVQDGTDFVITAESGETYTYSTAVGNYTRLVKRGAGEAVLDTASTGFSGSVVVEAGTLTVAHVSALGATSSGNSTLPITVESGATLNLKLPSGTKFGHNITIAGSGAGGTGAFKHTKNGGSGNSDSLINKLILSADATIDVSVRWGMADNKIIELNGHTLTRIGKGNWMVYNHIQSTDAPGEVNNTYGTLTFQGSPDIDENVTIVVTNLDSNVLGLWGASSVGTVKGKIKLYSDRTIQAQGGGAGIDANHIGPLHITGASGESATLKTDYKSSGVYQARGMSIDGPVTGDSGMKTSIEGIGNIWLNNDVSLSGNTTFACANAYLCGDDSKRDIKFVLKGSTTVTHEAGNTYARMLRVANGGAVAAQLRQTGGVLAVGFGDNARPAGESNGSRGYFTLEGGEAHFSNSVYMAEHKGSFGAFRQTGGLCELRRPANGSNERWFCAGRGGSIVFVQTGGTNDTLYVSNSQTGGFLMSTNGMAEVTVSGTGTLFQTTLFQLGTTGSVCTNILNVRDGAVFKANRMNKTNLAAAGTKGYINVDGGILMPTFFSNWSGHNNTTAYNPDHFVVYGNGITVDTSENSANSSAGLTTMPYVLEKPTGKGVESIALPDLTGTNYIGIGRIVIEDETGWGATAYAEYDFDTKTLTHVVVTSRGCNYSENAKAYLESPAGTSRYECVLTLSDNGGSGVFVKRGVPDLELSSADSTIDGGYAVEGGALKLGVVPGVAVPVRVESSATLNLNSKGNLTASTFEGAGNVINGNVTVTNAVRATCADIFAGNAAAFSGDLTLADGAVFEITDAENLATYKDNATAIALTANSISRQPALRLTNSNGTPYAGADADQWVLSLVGKTLKFGCPKPFTLVVR